MDTPDSTITRRVTRSQSAATTKNISFSGIVEESEEQILSKSMQRKKTAKQQHQESNKSSAPLFDITNNSPIIGIARGGSLQTPLSSSAMNGRSYSRKVTTTPGSGEALLRGQVKTLLQKVEEEGDFYHKIMPETRPIFPHSLQGFAASPMGPILLAPTPANTPLILSLSEEAESLKNGLDSVTIPMNPDMELTSQVVVNGIFRETDEVEKSSISRSLLLDFSDKSEVSDASEGSSLLTQTDGQSKDTDEDNLSVWSIQANASTREEDYEEETEEDDGEYCYDDEDNDVEGEYGGYVDELCLGIEKMSVLAAKFEGKHTRFVYDSDDEIVKEEKEVSGNDECLSNLLSPSIVKLAGLPTPKGKHVRFPLMDE